MKFNQKMTDSVLLRSYPKIRKRLSFPHAFQPNADQPQAERGNPDDAVNGCPIKTFEHDNWDDFLTGKSFRRGFTLIEIMLVVIIIGALSAMVIPRLSGRSEQAKIVAAQVDIETHLATALKLYELDNGYFPTTSQGLAALRVKPTDSPIPTNWNGPYIEKGPVDPWGHSYHYVSPGDHRSDYDLFSRGKDEKKDEDDITNWK